MSAWIGDAESFESSVRKTRGWERICEEDERRRVYLDSLRETWREQVAEHHRVMGVKPKPRGWRARRKKSTRLPVAP